MQKEGLKSNTWKGIFCLIGSAFFFALLSTFSRAAGDLPVMQKGLFKNVFMLSTAYVGIRKSGASLRLDRKIAPPMMGRALFGTVGSLVNLYVADHLLLADGSILSKTVPFMTVLLCFLFLKEPIHKNQIVCLLLGFIGTLLVIQPTLGTKELFPFFVGITGYLCVSIAYTCIRLLGSKGVNKSVTVFYFALVQTVVMIPYLILDYHPMSGKQVIFLLCSGLCATVGQFLVTSAYTFAPASDISVFDYTGVIFAALFGLFFYNQIPDWLSIIGYVVIFTAALLLLLVNKRLRK